MIRNFTPGISNIIVLTIFFYLSGFVFAENWTGWRGIEKQGFTQDSNTPIHWSENTNIIWKAPIPGEGNSSPIASSDSVFVTTSYDEKTTAHIAWCCHLFLLFSLYIFLYQTTRILQDRLDCYLHKFQFQEATQYIFIFMIALFIALSILFGRKLYNLQHCNIRQWFISSMLVCACLALISFQLKKSVHHRLLGIIFILFGIFVAWKGGFIFNHRPNAAPVIFSIISIPICSGIFLFIRKTKNNLNSHHSILLHNVFNCFYYIIACVFFIWFIIISIGLTRLFWGINFETSFPSYQPRIKGLWLLIFTLISLIPWLIGCTKQYQNHINKKIALTILPIWLFTLIAFSAERLINKSKYLSYHFGNPLITPDWGWWSVVVAMATILLACICHTIRRSHQPIYKHFFNVLMYINISCMIILVLFLNYRSHQMMSIRAIVCLDRTTGKQKWICEAIRCAKGDYHSQNTPATPTPVLLGDTIIAYFGSAGMVAVDKNGHLLWKNQILPNFCFYGTSCSPTAYQNIILILSENKKKESYLAAINPKDGKILWKTTRNLPIHISGNTRSPLISYQQETTCVIIAGEKDISGYDLFTGKNLWTYDSEGVGGDIVASPLLIDDILYLAGNNRIDAYKVSTFFAGKEDLLWSQNIHGPNCSTPLKVGDYIYTVSDTGWFSCINCRTHNIQYELCLPQRGNYYSSIIGTKNYLYLSTTQGLTVVLKTGPTFQKTSENFLPEGIYATLVPIDDSLFIRTTTHLYSIKNQK